MHTYKIAAALLLSAGIFCACDTQVVSRRQYDDLMAELQETKEAKTAIQQGYIDQNKEMGSILAELASISTRTVSLREDVESGKAAMTTAEQIDNSIRNIKARINSLEKENSALKGKNKEFAKMLDGLKDVIAQKEGEISSLKQEIAAKDETIARQGKTISDQKETISQQLETIEHQNEQLRSKVAQQARMLFDAGSLLEDIADNVPEVRLRRNKEKVSMLAQDIYKKARSYYQMAAEAGNSDAAEAIASVNAKIQAE